MKKSLSLLLVLIIIGTLLSGCSVANYFIRDNLKDKELCTVNTSDATCFTYKEQEYTILSETVSSTEMGEWVGYIQKLAILDEGYAVIAEYDIELNIPDFSNLPAGAMYAIPYHNVYALNGDKLVVNVDGANHVAIPSASVAQSQSVISFSEYEGGASNDVQINPDNCTQLIYNGKTYQISDDEVDKTERGSLIAVLAFHITFDSDTKEQIPEKDLQAFELTPGDLSAQARTTWSFQSVYTLKNTGDNSTIVVEVNHKLVKAYMI